MCMWKNSEEVLYGLGKRHLTFLLPAFFQLRDALLSQTFLSSRSLREIGWVADSLAGQQWPYSKSVLQFES
ncbi:unnamed protein product [Calypogeia fissa]